MTQPPSAWKTFNADSLVPLSADERATTAKACVDFVARFNNGLDVPFRLKWTASPRNFSDLDYDFYEFGGSHWRQDHGYSFTCAWAEILVNSFGFQWMKMEGAQSLRDWVLKHDDAFYVFFPWQTLWSVVESAGNQFTKAEGAWLRILREVDDVYPLPTGWYPASDAMTGANGSIPAKVVTALQAIYDQTPDFYQLLGLWPYEWGDQPDWEPILQRLTLERMQLPDRKMGS